MGLLGGSARCQRIYAPLSCHPTHAHAESRFPCLPLEWEHWSTWKIGSKVARKRYRWGTGWVKEVRTGIRNIQEIMCDYFFIFSNMFFLWEMWCKKEKNQSSFDGWWAKTDSKVINCKIKECLSSSFCNAHKQTVMWHCNAKRKVGPFAHNSLKKTCKTTEYLYALPAGSPYMFSTHLPRCGKIDAWIFSHHHNTPLDIKQCRGRSRMWRH